MLISDHVRVLRKPLSAALLCLAGLGVYGAEIPADTKTLEIPYRQGQLMSLIAVDPKEGEAAATARQKYLGGAIRLAREYGLETLGSLSVSMAIIGDFHPSALVFYAWPSEEAEASFASAPGWSSIRETRPFGWDELRIHDRVATKDEALTFRSDRFYTLATAWINPEYPRDYETYLKNIEPAMAAAGGRFFYEMESPDFVSLQDGLETPSRLTLVEWKEPAALDRFLNSQGFKRNAELLNRGTSAFELLSLSVNPRT
ncbi:MAG: DUF1330 domain-containing protein [Pseudomonadota bacterium]